jgi:hypothetical protein
VERISQVSPAAMDSAPPGLAATATMSHPANLVPLSVICSRFFIFSICARTIIYPHSCRAVTYVPRSKLSWASAGVPRSQA